MTAIEADQDVTPTTSTGNDQNLSWQEKTTSRKMKIAKLIHFIHELKAKFMNNETQKPNKPGYLMNGHFEYWPSCGKIYSRRENKMHELNANCNILLQALLNGVSRKEELIESVWHQRGMIVAENSYHQLIKLLRDRFSEIGLDPAQIKTIPRHGVLFHGEARPLETRAPRSRRRLHLGILFLLIIGGTYLAVWRYQPQQPPIFRPLMRLGSSTIFVHVSSTALDQAHLIQLVRDVTPSQPFIYYIKRGNAEWIAACPTQITSDSESCTSRLYYWP